MKKKKSIWIDVDTIEDIEKEARDEGTKFAVIVNRRLKQHDNSQLPAILAKAQTLINLTHEGRTEDAQKVENESWKLLK